MTMARRSDSRLSEVRSVESFSGSIGKYLSHRIDRGGVFAAHDRPAPIFFLTTASTSAMATRILTASLGMDSPTVSWSRSRESSLSMEHQRRFRRSRAAPSTCVAGRGFHQARRAPGAENLEPSLFQASPDGQFFAVSSGGCWSSVFVILSPSYNPAVDAKNRCAKPHLADEIALPCVLKMP